MSHDPRQTSLMTPILQVAAPGPAWQVLAVLGMLSLQFCFLMLVAWRLLPMNGDNSLRGATIQGNQLAATREREATLDAKLEVLETIVRQGSKAPEGVVQSLVDQTAQVQELRTSLRGQQSMGRELEQKITDLEASLADAQRRDERQQTEFAALQTKFANLSTSLQEARDQLVDERSNDKSEADPPQTSWWTSLRMNSKPIGLGVVLGAIAVGAVAVALQHAKRTAANEISAGAHID